MKSSVLSSLLATNALLILISAACAPLPGTRPITDPANTSTSEVVLSKGAQQGAVSTDEFMAYRDYLRALGISSPKKSKMVITATIVALTQMDLCPERTDPCPLETNPRDVGVIRIHKAVVVTPDQPAATELGTDGQSNSNEEVDRFSNGADGAIASAMPHAAGTVDLEREYNATFVLTSRPVLVRGLSLGASNASVIVQPIESGSSVAISQTDASAAGQERRPHRLIRENGKLRFVIGVGLASDFVRHLPGLEIGDVIEAAVDYDGRFYIGEYTVIDHKKSQVQQ